MQTQQSEKNMPLRRSTRERRTTIADDYFVFLQEHENDLDMVEDPVNFHQAKQSSNSEKWINAMNDEMKCMIKMTFVISLNCLKLSNLLVVNEYLKPKGIQKAISRNIRHV